MKTTKELFDSIYRAIACTPNNSPTFTTESAKRIRTAIDTLKEIEAITNADIPHPGIINRATTLLEAIFDEKRTSPEDRNRYLDQIRDQTPALS